MAWRSGESEGNAGVTSKEDDVIMGGCTITICGSSTFCNIRETSALAVMFFFKLFCFKNLLALHVGGVVWNIYEGVMTRLICLHDCGKGTLI